MFENGTYLGLFQMSCSFCKIYAHKFTNLIQKYAMLLLQQNVPEFPTRK